MSIQAQPNVLNVSVIIPALNARATLPATIAACTGVREILVVDGGSYDGTADLAKALGARLTTTDAGRGLQLRTGAYQAKGEWFLFLHADTVLTGGWHKEIEDFVSGQANRGHAATFRFALDDSSPQARRLERWVAWRVARLGLPYGDQGLLIHRDFYRAIGGYLPWPLMEDVALVRRIGRWRLTIFESAAITSSERWQREGWTRRSLKNLTCLTLYFLGLSPRLLKRLYG